MNRFDLLKNVNKFDTQGVQNAVFFLTFIVKTNFFNPKPFCLMKNFLHVLKVSLLIAAAGYLTTGCKDDTTEDPATPDVASLAAEVVTVSSTSADVRLTTHKITEAAYLAAPEGEEAPDAAVIFATGTRGIDCQEGDFVTTVRGLDPLTAYNVYFAGITDEEAYTDVVSVSVTTTDFSEDVAAYGITPTSFKVRVRVPENLATSGNVIKWGLSDIAMYNMNTKMYGYTSADIMNLNDEYYHNFFTEDKEFSFSNDLQDICVVDENGEIEPDPWNGEYKYYYEPIVPGGKYITTFGEYALAEDQMGWGLGYYGPLFDYEGYLNASNTGQSSDEKDYWTGFYARIDTQLTTPEKLDASLNITTNLRPNGGVISFTPDENITQYVYTIMDDANYQMMLSMLLDNDESNVQWFLTTTLAMMSFSVMSTTEPVDLVIEDFYYEVDRTATYHILAVGMGNEEGTTQCFEHQTFTLPEPTKPAPELTVTPIKNPNGEDSPYEVWFNVKSSDVLTGSYVANYERDWMSMIDLGYTAEDLLSNYGVELSSTEIGQINSSEGLNICFTSLANSTTYIAVSVANDEGTSSEVVVAQNTTIEEPDAERVSSSLFTDLLGDWTATATIQYDEYDYETFTFVTKQAQKQSKVTIGDTTYPEVLPDEIYELFFNTTSYKTKEEVDAVYAQFKASVDQFNQKTRNQNRLLCQGLSLELVIYEDNLRYASPYDLFSSETYNGYDIESPVFDFGPKWYLQIDENDQVSVPFNMNRFTPLSGWGSSIYYLLGASTGEEGNVLPYIQNGTASENGYFPVEISADKNTITINPLNYNGKDYYMNPGSYSNGYYMFQSNVVSPVTLTRGWSGDDDAASSSSLDNVRKRYEPFQLKSRYQINPVTRYKSRTPVAVKPAVERKQVKINHVLTQKEAKANMDAFMEKLHGKR